MKNLFSAAMTVAVSVLTSNVAMAAPDPALCGLMDSQMLSSLKMAGAPVSVPPPPAPPASAAPIDVATCTWSNKSGMALTLSSSPFKGVLPTSCNVQQIAGGSLMTMCMASGPGAILTIVLVQPAGKADQDTAAKLRRHTEALAAKLGKAAKPS